MKLGAVTLFGLLAVTGCGSSDGEAPPEPVDPTAHWPTLLSADWTIPGGTDGYVCARKTIDEDVFIAGFAAVPSTGTHHALLTMGVPDAPDGVGPCSFDTTFSVTVFGAGTTSKPLEFPEGVATKIPKGAQLLLNVHIMNPDQSPRSGTAGTRVLTIPASEVLERAEHFAALAQEVEIPARSTRTHVGSCTVRSDMTLVAVAPHMHQLGRHEKVVAETASGEVTLFDAAFTFGEQTYSVLEPVPVAIGDRLRLECTHENTTDAIVTDGPSIENEMCMATFYRYPVGDIAFCLDE